MSRIELLHRLIEASMPIPEAVSRLAELSWDGEEDLVELVPEHCSNVISQFLRGAIAGTEVEAWANAVECREDVKINSSLVGEVLHELANPTLTHCLSPARGKELLSQLQYAG
ncbi:TPA: hypothetical protein MI944_29695 [Klebsiella pneumoniae]|nr:MULTISPECIES: hypothetical protein [Enterobacteriaceae]MBV7062891.1 hypothetical protein [Escherichia coli]HBY9035595.1 hypothetical protein [Klebsiella pneumoniae]HBY9035827.1 hypothetical protein [Klebsiella pneumoniae]